MKIAVVLPGRLPVPATKGGAVETLTDLFIQQNGINQEFEIVLYCSYDHESYSLAKKIKGLKVTHVTPSKFENSIFMGKRVMRKIINIPIRTAYLSRLLKELGKEDFDRIIIENAYEYVLPIKNRFPEKEIIFHVHNHIFNSDIGKNDPSEVLESCDKILVVSNYIKNYLLSLTNRVFESKIHVVKNGIDIRRFMVSDRVKQDVWRQKFGIKENEFVFLFCGRIVPEKGIKELILAFNTVVDKYPFCKLLIVGSTGNNFAYSNNKNAFLEELYSLTKDQKDRIIFTGYIHNHELPLIHAISNVLVVPSTCQEAAGLVITEGLASGLTVIASNVGGIPEYINEEICRLVNVDDHFIENLSMEMEYILKIPKSENLSIAQNFSFSFDKMEYYNRLSECIRA